MDTLEKMMKKIQVSTATNNQLNWLVAKCERTDYIPVSGVNGIGMEFSATTYTTDWSLMGPIVDREFISLTGWRTPTHDMRVAHLELVSTSVMGKGPTALIATARCYVVSKLGEEVEIPEELE